MGIIARVRRWLRGPSSNAITPGRVDALLRDVEQTAPAIGRIRWVPIDLIADAVATDLGAAAASDALIQASLVRIARRNDVPLTLIPQQ